MDLTEILEILEPDFQRNTVQATDYPTGISYINTNGHDITVNEDTYTNPAPCTPYSGRDFGQSVMSVEGLNSVKRNKCFFSVYCFGGLFSLECGI